MRKIPKQIFLKGFLAFLFLVFLYNFVRPAVTRFRGKKRVFSILSHGWNSGEEASVHNAAMPNRELSGRYQFNTVEDRLKAEEKTEAFSAFAQMREIIKSAQLSIQVSDIGKAYNKILSAASASSGYILRSNFNSDGSSYAKTASFVLEVPSYQFDETVGEIGKMGKVTSRNISGQDVTEEYTDLQARLRNLRNVEVQFTLLLSRAKTINDILIVQDRLNQVQGEIEQAKGRIQLLSHESAMSEISIDVTEVIPLAQPSPPGFVEKLWLQFANEMKDDLASVTHALVQTLSTLVILAIWITGYFLPLFLAGWVVWKLVAKYGKQLKAQI